MAQAPYIGGNCRCLSVGKLCSAHRRHRASVLLGSWYAFSNDLEDFCETAVAPQIFLLREIRTKRCPRAIGTVAACTRCAADLLVDTATTESDHLWRRAFGNRHVRRIAFGRLSG